MNATRSVVHGLHLIRIALYTNDKRDDTIREILSRVWYHDISADDGYDLIEGLL